MLANTERGEVLVEIGGEKAVLCFHMERLAAYSAMLGHPPLGDMLRRINGAEPVALIGLIDAFTIKGDGAALKAKVTHIEDMAALVAAGLKMMEPFLSDRKPDPKNG